MASFTNLVTRFSQELATRCTDADAVTLVTTQLSNWESEFQQHFTGKPAKKQRKAKEADPNRKKTTNWQAVWTSNANGCRAYPEFQEHLKSLEDANPNMGRFEINKQLREWAGSQGQYTTWQDWAKQRLIAAGAPVPQEKAVTTTGSDQVEETVVTETTTESAPVHAPTAVEAPVVGKATVPPVKPRGKASKNAAPQVVTATA